MLTKHRLLPGRELQHQHPVLDGGSPYGPTTVTKVKSDVLFEMAAGSFSGVIGERHLHQDLALVLLFHRPTTSQVVGAAVKGLDESLDCFV